MPRVSAGKKRRGLGYDGCLLDLVVLVLIAGVAFWGAHRWNALAHRPLGLPRIPVPRVTLPLQAREWLSKVRGAKVTTPPPPVSTPASTPTPAPTPSPTPEALVEPDRPTDEPPAPPLPGPSPTPSGEPEDSSFPVTAVVVPALKLAPQITPLADPLSVPATTLARQGDTLFLGLSDGGVAFRKGTGKNLAIGPPQSAGVVTSIAAGNGSVYWLAGGGSRLFAYRMKEKSLRAFELSTVGGPFEAVATLAGPGGTECIAVLGSGKTRFLEPETGKFSQTAESLPTEVVDQLTRPLTSLFLSRDPANGKRVALLVLSGDGVTPGAPASLALWTTEDCTHQEAWTRREIDPATVPAFSRLRYREAAGRAAVALTPSGLGLLTPPDGGPTLAAGKVWTAGWTPEGDGALSLRVCGTLPEGVSGLWAAPDRVSLGKSGIWWVFGGVVFHEIPAKPDGATTVESYLPWNGAGTKTVTALLADDTGAWVATERGVRHITPGKPSTEKGYDGYLLARLGTGTGQPPAAASCQKLAQMTKEWEGTPYLWGGNAKTGVDCSGYVCALFAGVGVSVPRKSDELPTASGGKPVRDELRYGDVLVFPGHCAVYVGNGWTSEAMTELGVGKATVWGRKQVAVRRFLRPAAATSL